MHFTPNQVSMVVTRPAHESRSRPALPLGWPHFTPGWPGAWEWVTLHDLVTPITIVLLWGGNQHMLRLPTACGRHVDTQKNQFMPYCVYDFHWGYVFACHAYCRKSMLTQSLTEYWGKPLTNSDRPTLDMMMKRIKGWVIKKSLWTVYSLRIINVYCVSHFIHIYFNYPWSHFIVFIMLGKFDTPV